MVKTPLAIWNHILTCASFSKEPFHRMPVVNNIEHGGSNNSFYSASVHNNYSGDSLHNEEDVDNSDISDFTAADMSDLRNKYEKLRQTNKKVTDIMKRLQKEKKGSEQHIQSQKRGLEFFQLDNNLMERTMTQKAKKARRDTSQTVKKKADLKTVLNNHIFPFNKFVLKQHLKDITDGSIGFEIMNQLGLEMKEMPNFWAWHHSEVENCFQEYRSGAQQQMKNSFFDGRNFNFNFMADTFSLTFPFQRFLNSLGQYARWKM